MITPIEAHDKIREICLKRPDLAWKDKYWTPKLQYDPTIKDIKRKPYQGHCYVASHAFAHLVSEATIYTNEDCSHYWNQIGEEIWDLTKEQFDKKFDYSNGRKVRKKTKPTKRVQEILNEINL